MVDDLHIPLGPFIAVVITISMIGFVTGTSGPSGQWKQKRTNVPVSVQSSEVPTARSYTQMRQTARGQVTWPSPSPALANSTTSSATPTPKPSENPDKAALQRYLGERQARRAYDGAPPTIPHPVRQNSASECLACHGQDLKLGKKVAGSLPHDSLTNCNQCHVPSNGPFPGKFEVAKDPREVENSFNGQPSPNGGNRAWSIAPPQVPHTSWMRENCLACHGSKAAYPMRSSHPERQNCSQCHAASAQDSLRPSVMPGMVQGTMP